MNTYTVTGHRQVAGVEPGGTVELDDDTAARLIAGGHVTADGKAAPSGNEPTTDPGGEQGEATDG